MEENSTLIIETRKYEPLKKEIDKYYNMLIKAQYYCFDDQALNHRGTLRIRGQIISNVFYEHNILAECKRGFHLTLKSWIENFVIRGYEFILDNLVEIMENEKLQF